MGNVVGGNSGFTFDTPIISSFGNTGDKRITISVPFTAFDAISGDVGTIEIPLVSEKPISAVVTDIGSPDATSSLLEAKAQAYRYVVFAHSTGGSSGQAETLGNDAIVSLGEGFAEIDSTHMGTEGSPAEIAGTYMHEIGHLLNLNHGGPISLLNEPDKTLISTALNCVPIQRSIMSYTGQLPGFLESEWSLSFNEEAATFSEVGLSESDGVSIDGEPLIVWGTPDSTFGTFKTGTASGALDWNGDGDTLDSGNFDLNNVGIAGCQSSPGQSYETFNEPDNFNFNFRDTSSGQFDGGNDALIAENTDVTAKIISNVGADIDVLPPFETDGTETRNAGSNIPLKFKLFQSQVSESDPAVAITDAIVRADIVREIDGQVIIETLGTFDFVDFGGNGHYRINWNTDESFTGETIGIRYVNQVPIGTGPDGEFGTLDDEINEIPLNLSEENNPQQHIIGEVGVTVLVEFR